VEPSELVEKEDILKYKIAVLTYVSGSWINKPGKEANSKLQIYGCQDEFCALGMQSTMYDFDRLLLQGQLSSKSVTASNMHTTCHCLLPAYHESVASSLDTNTRELSPRMMNTAAQLIGIAMKA
jgi:hypothetical protein